MFGREGQERDKSASKNKQVCREIFFEMRIWNINLRVIG